MVSVKVVWHPFLLTLLAFLAAIMFGIMTGKKEAMIWIVLAGVLCEMGAYAISAVIDIWG